MAKRSGGKRLAIGVAVAGAIVGGVYFVAGVAFQKWAGAPDASNPLKAEGADWIAKYGHGPGPKDFTDPNHPAPWWSYLVGRRSGGAFLAFNRA